MIPEAEAKTVRIPVRIARGAVHFFYGGPLPELKEGTVGDLVIPAFSVLEPERLRQLDWEMTSPLLPSGTPLLAIVDPGEQKPSSGLEELPQHAFGGSHGALFARIVLEESLAIRLRGTKKAILRPCRCRIPALGRQAESVNHAYTLISAEFEQWRRSHSGNVFQKVYYQRRRPDSERQWYALAELRALLEADFERRFPRPPAREE